MDGIITSEARFNAAVNIIKCLPKDGPFQPSHDMMLKFYGLYKQALEGPCQEPKPAFYEVVKGYKWRAWKSLGDMSKTDAMENYVDELKKIIETMSYTQDVANFIDALGPFYEFIDIPALKQKNNNNIKGLDDDGNNNDDDASQSFGVLDKPVEACMTNGHGKINGNAMSDTDTESEGASSQESSPELVSVENDSFRVPLSVDQVVTEADVEADDEKLVVMEVHNVVENITSHTLSLSPKVYSDSDSDEEYSEPAEISIDYPMLDLNRVLHPSTERTMPKPTIETKEDTASNDSHHCKESIMNDTVVCGGGDQSHPGGLQMTPRQTQGSGYSTSLFSMGNSKELAAPAGSSRLLRASGSGGGNEGGGRKESNSSVSDDVNAQLMILLRRLQTDMESVLHRLNNLETLAVNHHTYHHHCQVGSPDAGPVQSERSWWPFPELSPRSTFFLLIWPLLLHGGIKFLLLLRSRRRRQ